MNKDKLNISVTREEVFAVYAEGPEAVYELVSGLLTLFDERLASQASQIDQLQSRIATLESQLQKDSHNSSKPPATDSFKRRVKHSQRAKTSAKVGGQKGHKGKTLEFSLHPDEVVIHRVTQCKSCCISLLDTEPIDYERRQVFDIPPLKLQVIEHHAQIKICPCCSSTTKASFPKGIDNYVQYGTHIKSLAVYLNNYQLLPYQRMKEFFFDVFSHSLSVATLQKANKTCYEALQTTQERIKEMLLHSRVVHFDETGYSVNKTRHWLHVASTCDLTYYFPHPKRGRKAMDELGILPEFEGVALHDFWQSYLAYTCQHALCNAHHLRDLTFIIEVYQQKWAKKMKTLLRLIKKSVDQTKTKTNSLNQHQINAFEKQYQIILKQGFKENRAPPITQKTKTRGRKKQTPAKNLLDRFQKYQKEILAFMIDFNIPFDNNQAERDIRMMKVQQKISGCFRTQIGANIFCRIRGYISTARKQNVNVYDAISNAFLGNPFIPEWAE